MSWIKLPPNLKDFKGKTTLQCQITGLTTSSDWGEGVCFPVLLLTTCIMSGVMHLLCTCYALVAFITTFLYC